MWLNYGDAGLFNLDQAYRICLDGDADSAHTNLVLCFPDGSKKAIFTGTWDRCNSIFNRIIWHMRHGKGLYDMTEGGE